MGDSTPLTVMVFTFLPQEFGCHIPKTPSQGSLLWKLWMVVDKWGQIFILDFGFQI